MRHLNSSFKIASCVLSLVLTVVAIPSQANDIGVLVGVRSDSATSNTSGFNIGTQTNYMAGVLGLFDVASQVQIRSGLAYTQRNYSYTPAVGNGGNVYLGYMDIPVGVVWKFTDYGGPFIGANLGLNVSSSCPGTCSGVQSLPVGLQLGAQFKFAPQLAAALYYEAMSGLLTNFDSPKAVVLQFQVLFY